MNKSRRFNAFLVVVILVAMVACGKYYFTLFTNEIEKFSERDSLILHEYNDEIIERLQNTKDTAQWQKIIDSYSEIIIHVEDSSGNLIALTSDREWSMLDVKIQTPFKFQDDAYMVRSSVYFLRGYLTDSNYLFRFIFAILLVIFLAGIFIVAIIYAFMLRPVYRLYHNIERYESGIKPKRTSHRSQIGMLQNRFVDMTETIDKQQQNEKRIIASISHDIKTPLTSIMGYAELLKKENLSEERKQRYLSTVYQKSMDIKGLIDDFDEYLSYNMKSSVHTEKMSVSRMMEKLVDGYEEELSQYGAELIFHKPDFDSTVEVDITKMRRVFGNIIGNSVKHFRPGRKLVEINCSEDGQYFLMEISDNGDGVEESKLEMIFEPLYTSDEGRKVAGLGLAICREIVESHGGIVYAEKSVYGGLSVIIKLKLK